MEPKEACVHHWDIESAEGPNSLGTCRYCLTTKNFRNSTAHTSLFSHLEVPRGESTEGDYRKVDLKFGKGCNKDVED